MSTGLLLTQRKYISDLLHRAKMSTCSPVGTLATPSDKLSAKEGQAFYNETLFWSIVVGLQYLAFTHPDIAFVVNKVSQFMHCPCHTLPLCKA